jgi:hypothetical protein
MVDSITHASFEQHGPDDLHQVVPFTRWVHLQGLLGYVSDADFRSAWPIQFHLILVISAVGMYSWFVWYIFFLTNINVVALGIDSSINKLLPSPTLDCTEWE